MSLNLQRVPEGIILTARDHESTVRILISVDEAVSMAHDIIADATFRQRVREPDEICAAPAPNGTRWDLLDFDEQPRGQPARPLRTSSELLTGRLPGMDRLAADLAKASEDGLLPFKQERPNDLFGSSVAEKLVMTQERLAQAAADRKRLWE